jgi:hypothetical protein
LISAEFSPINTDAYFPAECVREQPRRELRESISIDKKKKWSQPKERETESVNTRGRHVQQIRSLCSLVRVARHCPARLYNIATRHFVTLLSLAHPTVSVISHLGQRKSIPVTVTLCISFICTGRLTELQATIDDLVFWPHFRLWLKLNGNSCLNKKIVSGKVLERGVVT